MTLRITQTKVGEVMQVTLAGRITRREAEHLLQANAWDRGSWVVDLANLLSADEAGVHALQQLRAQGVGLVRPKPYMALLLNQQNLPETAKKNLFE